MGVPPVGSRAERQLIPMRNQAIVTSASLLIGSQAPNQFLEHLSAMLIILELIEARACRRQKHDVSGLR